MGVKWTGEQQKVIDLRGRNILVSAAAGSGKTAVLVERIITMLTDVRHPVDVDRLLVVTFTEAAAAEMKERIRNAIEKKMAECPEDAHLRQQATLIHSAKITTIHSFCLSVIKDHFHVIDLDPGFRIGEEGELRLLRQDVLDQILEERYEAKDSQFLEFVMAYAGGRDDKNLNDLILKLYEFSRSYPDAGGWLASCSDAYQAEDEEAFFGSPYIHLLTTNVSRYLKDAKDLLEQGICICREEDGPKVYEGTLQSDIAVIEELLGSRGYREQSKAFAKVSWARLASNRDKTVSEEKACQVKAMREQVKGTVKDLASQYFYQGIEEMLSDIAACRPHIDMLVSLVAEFARQFEISKKERNMIDFSDMEQYALRILARRTEDGFASTAVAREYQEQFQEIMIDEYQDSNLIQETILGSISTVSEGMYNIFMVGDVKQSIYRFRLSRPELFMEKFHTYDVEDSQTQRIDLHKNFRSRGEVLESVNYIFGQIMTPALGKIAYDEQAALYKGYDYPESSGNYTEALMIETDTKEWDQENCLKASPKELEARAIALRIRELLSEQMVTDRQTGELRRARYSDIVILTRSIKGFSDVFSELLNKEGIPTYASSREGYFSAWEVGVMLDYLRALDNFRQDIPLAAVLKSPLCGLTSEEMAVIKSSCGDKMFCLAVAEYAAQGKNKNIRDKLSECLEQMERFRKMVSYMPMHELIWRILADTGYEDYIYAMPGGEQRKANLEMLAERAKAFEATSYKGLFHFVRYIEQLKKYHVDYGEAGIEDEQSDTVRVMTIHKSKGLEFPIVIVAGMGKRINMQDARSSVVLHSRLGAGLDAVDSKKRTKCPSILKKVIQREEQLDSLGEELRILYVAFTRAKEKLILTGTIKDAGKKLSACSVVACHRDQALPFNVLSKASAYWDWLLPALVRKPEDVPIKLRCLDALDIVSERVVEESRDSVNKKVLQQWDTQRVFDGKMRAALEEQMLFHYPYESSLDRKLKFTVSELKKRAYLVEESGEVMYEEPDVIPLIPRFLKEEQLTGASRGTAYHRVMELLDLKEEYDEDALKSAIGHMAEQGRIGSEISECIRISDIISFLRSEYGGRMRACARAQRLYKEQPFVLGVDARELYPEEKKGELILVQGIIDVYFEEEEGLTVLDYKTDNIKDIKELGEKYHAQLDYYAKALHQLTNKKIKEKVIYSFTLHEAITV